MNINGGYIALLFVLVVCSNAFSENKENVLSDGSKVITGYATVTDGDTIKINGEKIRLAGIDAPEKKQPFGKASRSYLKKLTDGNTVTCKYDKRDRYGRIIGSCSISSWWGYYSTDINDAMVEAGLAYAYTDYSKKYLLTEEYARNKGKGVWGYSKKLELPKDYRRRKRSKK